MVLEGITTRLRTQLVILNETLTARQYIGNILQPVVVPFLQANADVTTLQEDNARLHSYRIIHGFLRQ